MANSTAMLAVQKAVILALNVPAVTNLAPVSEAVAEGQPYPYVEIGEIEETLNNVFTKNGRSVLVSIHIYSEQSGFKEAEAILEQINILLDDTLLPDPPGWKTIQNFYEIGTAHKEFDVKELRHVIGRYRFEVEQFP